MISKKHGINGIKSTVKVPDFTKKRISKANIDEYDDGLSQEPNRNIENE